MKKRIVALAFLFVLPLAACRCTAEKAAVSRLEQQHEKLSVKYSAYVAADPKLDAKSKDDELGLVRSIRDLILSLKRSLED